MDDFIDVVIEMYTISPKRKQIQKREMEDFRRFFASFIETDDKYIHMRTAGLVFIYENEKQIYQKISEAVPNIHNRSKDYQSIARSKAVGIGRRRSRRLV
jgi:tricorn protease-like protein